MLVLGLSLASLISSLLLPFFCCLFFSKQTTAYEMRISDWTSDVCSSDLSPTPPPWHSSKLPAGTFWPQKPKPAWAITSPCPWSERTACRTTAIFGQSLLRKG